ncbi:MAG: hypothetical protein H6622_07130 [Halobacteriovoraceae bacterium]|nr:hypothetical protein [Halobacteriovoraceae bacterium]
MNKLIKTLLLFSLLFNSYGADSDDASKTKINSKDQISSEIVKINELKKQYLDLPKESSEFQKFEVQRKLINQIYVNIRSNILPYEAEIKDHSESMTKKIEEFKTVLQQSKELGAPFERLDLERARKFAKYESIQDGEKSAGLIFLENIKDLKLDTKMSDQIKFENSSNKDPEVSKAAQEDILKRYISRYLEQTVELSKDANGEINIHEQLESLKFAIYSQFSAEDSSDHLKYQLLMLYIDQLLNADDAKFSSFNDYHFPSCILVPAEKNIYEGKCTSENIGKKDQTEKEIVCNIDPSLKVQPLTEEVKENVTEVVETTQEAVASKDELQKKEDTPTKTELSKDDRIAELEKEKAELLEKIEKNKDEDEEVVSSSKSKKVSKEQTETLSAVVTVLQPLILSMTDMMSKMLANQNSQANPSLELLKLQMQNNYMKEMYDFKLKTYENMWDRFYVPQVQYNWRNNNINSGYNVYDTNSYILDRSNIDTNNVDNFTIPSFLQASRSNPYTLGSNSFNFGNRTDSFLF